MKKRYGEENENTKEIIKIDKKRSATNSKVKKMKKTCINTAIIVMANVIIIIIYTSISNFNIFKKIILFLEQKSNNLKINLSNNKFKNIFYYNNISSTNYTEKKQLNIQNINIKDMNNYIELCRDDKLIGSIPKVMDNPKITVVIAVYNAHEYLKKTIRSIQNQKMEEIEIIIIDDFSKDNSKELILKMQKEDPRIKYIQNKENRGTLYSRSIGALNAKAKYIMTIDNDDLFLPGIFNICYEEAEINNIDIIEFSGCVIRINTFVRSCNTPLFLKFKENGKIIKQPELSIFMFRKENKINRINYRIIDAYLWGKIIKTSIYLKALENIGEEIYSQYVCYCEDRLVNFALFRVASSFKYINRKGIIYNRHPKSVGRTWKNKTKILHDELINIKSIYKLTKNTNYSFLAVVQFMNVWRHTSNGLTPKNKETAQKIAKKMLNDAYIPEFRKKEIIEAVKDKLDLNLF